MPQLSLNTSDSNATIFTMKKVIVPLFLLLAVAVGFFASSWYSSWQQTVVQEQSQVLLERIATVTKLITIEGYFSDIYDYKDYYGYDLSPFRKKALLRVKAKVSVGYDLEGMTISSFPEEKLIQIRQLPNPEILSIDHDIDYYDITEGTFNYFSESDLSTLNDKAKAYIEQKAASSQLMETAIQQGNQVLEVIRLLVEDAGWRVEIVSDTTANEIG